MGYSETHISVVEIRSVCLEVSQVTTLVMQSIGTSFSFYPARHFFPDSLTSSPRTPCFSRCCFPVCGFGVLPSFPALRHGTERENYRGFIEEKTMRGEMSYRIALTYIINYSPPITFSISLNQLFGFPDFCRHYSPVFLLALLSIVDKNRKKTFIRLLSITNPGIRIDVILVIMDHRSHSCLIISCGFPYHCVNILRFPFACHIYTGCTGYTTHTNTDTLTRMHAVRKCNGRVYFCLYLAFFGLSFFDRMKTKRAACALSYIAKNRN